MIGNILVINLSRETETKTDLLGQFEIQAQSGDLLVFSAEFIYKKRHLIEDSDFNKILEIHIESKPIEIESVEINAYNDINAVSLGIISHAVPQYTHLEKKLKTASNLDLRMGIGITGGVSMSLDPIINAFTGKTKMLKNLVTMEREDYRVNYLSGLFDEDFFTQNLLIPKDNISEFKYYAAYFLRDLLPSKKDSAIKSSKDKIELELIPLAKKYLELQEETEK